MQTLGDFFIYMGSEQPCSIQISLCLAEEGLKSTVVSFFGLILVSIRLTHLLFFAIH